MLRPISRLSVCLLLSDVKRTAQKAKDGRDAERRLIEKEEYPNTATDIIMSREPDSTRLDSGVFLGPCCARIEEDFRLRRVAERPEGNREEPPAQVPTLSSHLAIECYSARRYASHAIDHRTMAHSSMENGHRRSCCQISPHFELSSGLLGPGDRLYCYELDTDV